MHLSIKMQRHQYSKPMITRLIIAAAVALFFTPAMPVCAQEHPEHPKKKEEGKKGEHPKKASGTEEVSTAEISAGIKKHIERDTKKSSEGKYHTKYEDKDRALALIQYHDAGLSS